MILDFTRILWFFAVRRRIALTNGFVKEMSKAPREEIVMALRYEDVYLSGKKNLRGLHPAPDDRTTVDEPGSGAGGSSG